MEGGFNLQVSQPIDPVVATNAEALTRIWEMWVPSRYRSIRVSGTEWSRIRNGRLLRADLYSVVDSTFSILQLADPKNRGYVLTIYGLDRRDDWGATKFAKLIIKTDPFWRN